MLNAPTLISPMPSQVRRWEPDAKTKARFAAAGRLTWTPNTVPLTGGLWVDGRWLNGAGDVILACDIATGDPCCQTCLTPTEVSYALLHYAETGEYLPIQSEPQVPPVLVLPGLHVSVEHVLGALRYLAVDLLDADPWDVNVQVPLFSRSDLR